MKIPCEFCGKPCSKGGALQYHIYHKHRADVVKKFELTLMLNHFEIWWDIQPKQLPEHCG